ncbi:MAG: VWA domain-containing protein, partial [Thermoleophilia bacterium]|nr:VWA domain-containing protein [Thermoleophilia bacterium]
VMLAIGERRRRAQAAVFGTPALLAASLPARRRIRRLLPFVLALVALATLIVGVARPRATLSVPDRSATVVLALDTSRSMSATDVKPSRLSAALSSARAFLDVAPKDFAVGIVTFSTSAAVALAPTTDRDAARVALDQIRLGSGTALGDAVDRSVEEARSGLNPLQPVPADAPPATVVLLSDGEQTSGTRTPKAAAEQAKKLGVPVNTVALGTSEAVVEVPLRNGLKERVTVAPDAKTLEEIARITGGRFTAAPTAERLEEIYRDLGGRLGKKREEREVTAAFAGAGAVLLLIASGLSVAWTRRPL